MCKLSLILRHHCQWWRKLLKPDPATVSAIVNMPVPTDKAALRCLLGVVNFLASHIPNLATITAPLHALLKTVIHFLLAHDRNNTLEKLKAFLSASPILQYFNPSVRNVIQEDASQHGLGACLLQKGQPIAYASQHVRNTECNYDHIEEGIVSHRIRLQQVAPLHLWFSYWCTVWS